MQSGSVWETDYVCDLSVTLQCKGLGCIKAVDKKNKQHVCFDVFWSWDLWCNPASLTGLYTSTSRVTKLQPHVEMVLPRKTKQLEDI